MLTNKLSIILQDVVDVFHVILDEKTTIFSKLFHIFGLVFVFLSIFMPVVVIHYVFIMHMKH